MKRPTSLTVLIFFTAWSGFKGLESLIRPENTKIMFDVNGIGVLYYFTVAVTVIGSVAVIYAITKRQEWGYKVGIAWLSVGIIYTIYTGIVSILNKSLMEQIMVTTSKAKGRSTDGIAEYINSSAFDATMVGTMIVMSGVMLFFIWKLTQHKNYFTSTSLVQE